MDEKLQNMIQIHVDKIRKIASEIINEIQAKSETLIGYILEYQDIISEESKSNAKEVIECIHHHIDLAKSLREMISIMNICDKLSMKTIHRIGMCHPLKIILNSILEKFEDGIKYREILIGDTT